MICPGCGEWFGRLEIHCVRCCRSFNSMRAFNQHVGVRRRGLTAKRHWAEDAMGEPVVAGVWVVGCAAHPVPVPRPGTAPGTAPEQ